ncbi:GNAT family N-acetyltransferase [Jeotgalibacillus haloalkalitolerans]|uniref:GNAT family N-acetyltransferase n=1 Tax=Jeotgalibacillus haloalkalitolerans TaxID=3104292 RepID=A0ABU5KQ09_9BACL|nr:GNAT family N-acetyltransferase [Jeotgalibacillus sp. HH7-29]MDZ5713349.1 GNAT family N-acetyltransferase [Jeotgalibacillus sp. HH7-29]
MMKTAEQAANRIAAANKDAAQYVGYCGTDADEIAKTIHEEIAEEHIYWFNDDLLILDYEDGSGEMWGPFINSSGADWSERANNLLNMIPEGTTLYGFYGHENSSAIEWMNSLGADQKGEEVILKASQFTPGKSAETMEIKALSDHEFSAFEQLHHQVFPETYYDAKTILNRANPSRPLLAAIDQGQFIGYIYAESDPEFGEGSVEYLAVNEAARGKGAGYTLLRSVMQLLLEEQQIKEISLCVSKNNQTAIRLYQRAGFHIEKELLYFKKNY